MFTCADHIILSKKRSHFHGSTTGVCRQHLFCKGADVGWLTQMEGVGYKFYNSAGVAMDCMQLLQSLGINSIRLRVWVNPAGGWNGNADVVAKAVRAHQLGMRILIDFHYSDTWADPGTRPSRLPGLLMISHPNQYRVAYTKSVLDT